MSTASRKISLIKSAKGSVVFDQCEPSGAKVTIKNTSGKGVELNGWKLEKTGGSDRKVFTFPEFTLGGGKDVSICAKGADCAGYGDLVFDTFTWGGQGRFILFDGQNNEKASMEVKMSN